MRDPDRIPEILEFVAEAWKQQRLGQLLVNAWEATGYSFCHELHSK